MKLKEDYVRANCCSPQAGDSITGYFSHNNIIKVHKSDCSNLNKTVQSRLVALEWSEIVAEKGFEPDDDYNQLTEPDFRVLIHHKTYGLDYSNKVAAVLRLDRKSVYDIHSRLKEMKLIERVAPTMIRYRKNIVPGKWIKHRNHTYYDLTEKGMKYLEYFFSQEK